MFGRNFPAESSDMTKSVNAAFDVSRYTTEEFIEDKYSVDIQYDLEIDSEVSEKGTFAGKLRRLSEIFPWLPTGRQLVFKVEACTVPPPYTLLWKVRNVGAEAERRRMIRGQIVSDDGRQQRKEETDFHGEHFVEAYVVKGDVCVARDLIDVRINQG